MRTDNKTILLVEDNPDDVALTLRALEKNNFVNDVVVSENGVEALDYLFGTGQYEGQKNPLPEVILLDLKMPKMDGLEVLHYLRNQERTRLQPIVVLTTSNEEKDRLESYRLGVNSYIRKPVSFDKFVEAIEQLGLYWLALNEAP